MGHKDWLYSNYNINIGMKREETGRDSVRYSCLDRDGMFSYKFTIKWYK